MSYQEKTGPLMANSHPGSYCGQDAYNDMLITDRGGTTYGWLGTDNYTRCICKTKQEH